MRRRRAALLLGTAVAVAACSTNAKNQRGSDDTGESPRDVATADVRPGDDAPPVDMASPLPDRCNAGVAWTPGTKAFRNATQEAGLEGIGAAGVRIAAGDIDGDGFADLAIRKAGSGADDFGTGTRNVWLLRNKGDGTFEDVTQASGIVDSRYDEDPNHGRPAEVFAFADIDNDGDLDAYTGFSQDGSIPDGGELMLNDGSGSFGFGPLGLPFGWVGEASSVGGASWTDVDRDGRVDLWIARGAVGGTPSADLLFRQKSDGTFEDATDTFGLTTEGWTTSALNAGRAHTNGWSSAACDLDGDGNPELLASSYGRSPNKLWHAVRTSNALAYENVSIPSGYAFDHRQDWSDNESARCWCKLHRTDPGCADVPEPRIVCEADGDAFRWDHARDREIWRLGGNSGTTVCGDLDNDGDLDLLTTEIVHWDVGSSADPAELLYNDGASPPVFERPGNEATGLVRSREGSTWDDGDITGAIFDFDNDGRADVYIGSTDYPGTRGWLFHQKGDGTFEPVAFADGIDHTRSHGIAIADYDRDGDLDVVVGHSTFRCDRGDDCYPTGNARYFENVVGQDGNWVQLALVGGEGTNRAAIGARVTVTANGVTQTQEIGGGHGHYGVQHDMVLHFGLADACTAEVSVRWPNGDLTEQTFGVQAGYRYTVKEGTAPAAQ